MITGPVTNRFLGDGRIAMIAIIALLTIVLAVAPAVSRPKTDKIVMRNGDRLSVEIVELSRGKLRAKTDDIGTIDIEWDKIRSIASDFYFQVTTSDGDIYFGALDMKDGVLRVVMLDEVAGLAQENVVDIDPIENTFLSRVDGSLSIGFDFTKASQVALFTFDWTNLYRGERHLGDFRANSVITDKREEKETTRRIDVLVGINRLLGRKKWFASGAVGYQRNDELGLRNRVIFSGGMGLSAVHSNHSLLRTSLGLAFNVEQSADSSQTAQSLEAIVSANYALFDYDSPKTDVTTKVELFPSLTESGRYRIEFDAKIRREVVTDFFVEFRYYTSADSKSPATGSWKSDYGIVMSLGWSY